ncbi:MAG: DNA repair protein RecN [Actinomycetota bacterium]|nr:DNA repair protein RecN [Actinomycetota bacterium]
MLHELRVENLLLIDRAELALAPGLNVLTGETGAGKTILANALDLLLGGRARSGTVRGGAAEAYVEGVFSLPPGLQGQACERVPAGAQELVLARRIWPDGRTRAYVCGRTCTVADLRELGSRELAFYGQHEHRKLMLSAAQLDVLDAHCGTGQMTLRDRARDAYERVRALEEQVARLREQDGSRERELDLVAFELDEIDSLGPSEQEAAELSAERDRCRHLETLRSAAAAATNAIASEAGGGACELLAQAARQCEPGGAIDPALGVLCERLRGLHYEAEDLGRELHSYLAGTEASPARLEMVEERLALFARLERKHGGSITEVLRHADRCRERQEELQHADRALQSAEAELTDARAERDRIAAELTKRRRRAAPALAAAVRGRLAELAMAEAQFEVELSPRADGCGPRGADTVQLSIAPNAGVRAGPLREIASGGELSRVMLALLSVAHGERTKGERTEQERAHTPLLVFDEIDAGIGGHTARAVGTHLEQLSTGRQVLCITHLPQVAALAARHFTIAKDPAAVPARTTVTALQGETVVGELVRMLGAGEGDSAAGQHARQLLRAAGASGRPGVSRRAA